MIGLATQRMMDCRRDTGAICGVNILLPKTNVAARERGLVTEKRF